VKKRIGSYPRVRVQGDGRAVVSQAGGVLLVEAVRKAGLDTAISAALTPWRKARAVHDPGKILLEVALAVALGGDCLADVAMLRAEPGVIGRLLDCDGSWCRVEVEGRRGWLQRADLWGVLPDETLR